MQSEDRNVHKTALNEYVVINGKKYKMGYTTGSCAAAAAKAAVKMLCYDEKIDKVKINTPAKKTLNLDLCDVYKSKDYVKCAVIKDGGDDPDITTGFKIFVEAKFKKSEGVDIKGGEGIGIVTMPGLKVKVGEIALNPIPRQMILKEVSEVLPEKTGVILTISVPGGEELAKKTYNPKLGIVGGISILGTDGIVKPMSEDAWKDAIFLEINMLKSKGEKEIVFTFGNIGKEFCENVLGICKDKIVIISNFLGSVLEEAVAKNFEKILLVGHIGKMVKVAAGNFNTHSRVSDGRIETIAAYCALEGAKKSIIERIFQCRTTDAANQIIKAQKLTNVYNRIAQNVANKATEYTYEKICCGAVLFNEDNKVLAVDSFGKEILKKLGSNYEK